MFLEKIAHGGALHFIPGLGVCYNTKENDINITWDYGPSSSKIYFYLYRAVESLSGWCPFLNAFIGYFILRHLVIILLVLLKNVLWIFCII